MSKNTTGEIPATDLPSRRRPTHPGVILLEQFLREILDAASDIDGAADIKCLPHEAERPGLA